MWWIAVAFAEEPSEVTWSGPLQVRQCPAVPRTLPADLAAVLDAVVVIRSGDGSGSGALVSPDGFVVTATHVLADEGDVTVELPSGLELPAQILRVDEVNDVALLHVPGAGHPCLPLAAVPTVGTELYVVGTPLADELAATVTRGIVSGVRTIEGHRLIQTDASINAGNSGGPLVDPTGAIVGIVNFKLVGDAVQGLGFGVPMDEVTALLALSWGDTSSDPTAGGGRRLASAPPLLEDGPEIAPYVPLTTRVDRPFDQGLLAAGSSIAAVGWLTVGATGLWYASNPVASPAQWRLAQGINAGGWAAVLLGSGLVVKGTLTSAGPSLRLGVAR